MENLLIKYMENRMKEKERLPVEVRHGPVLTISREAGCSANTIAKMVLDMINAKHQQQIAQHWKVVNKEIVFESAKELGMPADQINYVFKAEERKMIDEILAAMSNRYYKGDSVIRKTIMGVIRSIVEDGYVIMVGRGGVAFTRARANTLNIMLQAPLEWRMDVICRRFSLTPEEARENILHTDAERKLLVDHFCGSKTDGPIYDVVFNCASFDLHQIAGNILQLMEMKHLI